MNNEYHDYLVVGDFNIHYLTWGGPLAEILIRAEDILQIMDDKRLRLLLRSSIIIYQRYLRRNIEKGEIRPELTLDLVLVLEALAD